MASNAEAEEHVITLGGRNKMDNLGLWISFGIHIKISSP